MACTVGHTLTGRAGALGWIGIGGIMATGSTGRLVAAWTSVPVWIHDRGPTLVRTSTSAADPSFSAVRTIRS
ncbi:hypothetical protein OG462_03550 [Streptomyces sp. NBC_01077]|uniref:hypothetical protein n=1 Tax=Streptomyces sp. NBC_01077 TaxID=2903746 RepID=UPI003867213D|nr:hypothetical protein OG462_03550 [Streptomyces sp. NBC_01077]